ncbi:MAG: hypothetical protein CMP25_00195 [Rickettsiales bacterium]|nr:hypothetical protein [Rickettsiales bacterium]
MINTNHYYQSKNSKFLIIKGADRKKFLQGLISNDIYKLKPRVGIYSALLTPKGKFLFDFFLAERNNIIFLECKSEKIESIKLKLKIYKLRSNVEIETVDEKESFILPSTLKSKIEKLDFKHKMFYFDDPRLPKNFLKLYCSKKDFEKVNKNFNLKLIEEKDFKNVEINNFLPNFSDLVEEDSFFLLELRFDKLNGICWKKGCYMGQELTARSKYRANLKKRIFGIKVEGKLNKKKNEIFLNRKIVGHILTDNGCFGIAMIKITDAEVLNSKIELNSGDAQIFPIVPKWAI